ncbi:MAG: PIN domain-containing protein [Candidatus Thiodiazotropha endolucinida]
MLKLLFIDTNIYLDFYRIRNEVKASFLEHIEAIGESLIVTDQVEMEFKKNRQVAILEGMKELKPPAKINVPGMLKNDKSATALDKDQHKIQERIQKLKTRLDNVLENPGRYDKVYQVLQRLFSKKKDIDLYRKHKKRYEVRELAKKRFILGYPPRKKNDTSIGDATNWEWLIYVAEEKNADIWIVSRDSDYGVTQDNKGFLNDWLKQEFKERIHKKRKIVLCPKLSIALREFEIPVTKEEEQEEERIILEESVSVSDSVSARIFRNCEQCGQQFEAKGDEKSCPNCTPEWLT